jgi:hypothetical protein
MNDSDLIELDRIKARLASSMIGSMNGGGEGSNPRYTQPKLLREFIESLHNLGQDAEETQIIECVKNVVSSLNSLNDETDGCLIETYEREKLCAYIEYAARKSGLKGPEGGPEGDITEQWRMW